MEFVHVSSTFLPLVTANDTVGPKAQWRVQCGLAVGQLWFLEREKADCGRAHRVPTLTDRVQYPSLIADRVSNPFG